MASEEGELHALLTSEHMCNLLNETSEDLVDDLDCVFVKFNDEKDLISYLKGEDVDWSYRVTTKEEAHKQYPSDEGIEKMLAEKDMVILVIMSMAEAEEIIHVVSAFKRRKGEDEDVPPDVKVSSE